MTTPPVCIHPLFLFLLPYFSHSLLRLYSVSTYGIRQGSIIALIGGGDKPLPKPPSDALPINTGSRKSKPPVPTTEEGTIATIKAELSTIHETLIPMLNKFLDAVSPAADLSAAPPSNQPPEPTEGRTQGPSVSGQVSFLFPRF